MIKPSMPGMGAMNDTLDFMKNLWGGMGMSGASMPGMVMPTLSVEEINKKITDLKAVESWLTLNMNMLRSTIQALEVQAATISTLQSMGEQFSAGMSAASEATKATKGMPSFGAQPSTGNATSSPFAAQPPGAAAFTPPSSAASAPSATNNAADVPSAATGRASGMQPSGMDQANAANLTAPLVNAAAWWNMLQDQFKQAVSSAMTSESAPTPPKPASNEAKSSSNDVASPTPRAAASKTRAKPAVESEVKSTAKKRRPSR